MTHPTIDRRAFLDRLAAAAATLAAGQVASCVPSEGARADASDVGADVIADSPLVLAGLGGAPTIAMLLYPKLTLLDLIGPYTCMTTIGLRPQLVWKSRGPIESDDGVTVHATSAFAECPRELDVLFVPGGGGTADMMRDDDVLDFVASRGAKARFVTSVCTGSLILGAAGLLRGYRATSHWTVLDLLSILDATPVEARYVEDRNRITGGGVTSGIDFGLRIVDRLRGRSMAEGAQLAMEYAPEPPFHSGTPEQADALVVAAVRTISTPLWLDRKAAAESARRQF